MAFIAALCPSCGASISVPAENTTPFCMYCGNNFTTQHVFQKQNIDVGEDANAPIKNDKEDLLARAETLIKLEDYDRVRKIYSDICDRYPDDWRGWLSECKFHTISSSRDPKYYFEHGLFYTNRTSYNKALRIAITEKDRNTIKDEYLSYWRQTYKRWAEVPGAFPFNFFFGYSWSAKYYLPEFIDIEQIYTAAQKNAEPIKEILSNIKGFGLTNKQRWKSRAKKCLIFYSTICDKAPCVGYNYEVPSLTFALGNTFGISAGDDYYSIPSKHKYPYPQF